MVVRDIDDSTLTYGNADGAFVAIKVTHSVHLVLGWSTHADVYARTQTGICEGTERVSNDISWS